MNQNREFDDEIINPNEYSELEEREWFEEQFIHSDEFNRDVETELHKKDSYENTQEDLESPSTRKKQKKAKRTENHRKRHTHGLPAVKMAAITATAIMSTTIVTVAHEHVYQWMTEIQANCLMEGREIYA